MHGFADDECGWCSTMAEAQVVAYGGAGNPGSRGGTLFCSRDCALGGVCSLGAVCHLRLALPIAACGLFRHEDRIVHFTR